MFCQLITQRLIGEKRKSVFTRADFSAMAELGEKEGVLDQRESTLLQNFMMFKSVTAKDVMTPRTVVISALETQTLAEFHNEHPDLRFSRIPIYAKSIDEITGYIMRDDLLAKLVEDIDHEPLSTLRRDLKTVSEDFPIPELFSHFMSEHSHIAMVVDDFGGFAGIVTMEDVIETLLGMEIVDEVDGEADMQALARKQWERRASKMGLINTAE